MYNLYDNCPGATAVDSSISDEMSALELKRLLRKRLLPGGGATAEAVYTKDVHTEAARRHLGAIPNGTAHLAGSRDMTAMMTSAAPLPRRLAMSGFRVRS